MKALLVAESDHILDSFNNFFIENGYDTICYNWLLKALDNIEEIRPHVVLINSIDYPRHWKTLVQHIRSYIDASDLTVIIVIAENFDDDERIKAEILDVHCVYGDISQEVNEQLLKLLKLEQVTPLYSNEETESIVTQEQESIAPVESEDEQENIVSFEIENDEPIFIEPTFVDLHIETLNDTTNSDEVAEDSPIFMDKPIDTEEQSIEPNVQNEQETTEPIEIEDDELVLIEPTFVDLHIETLNNITNSNEVAKNFNGTRFSFSHPRTKVWVNGTVEHYNHPIIIFAPSNSANLYGIRFGKKIEGGTLTVAGVESQIDVQVQGIEDGMIEFCVVR